MNTNNYSDIIAGIDAMTNALARIKSALLNAAEPELPKLPFAEDEELSLQPADEPAKVSISDPLRPNRNTKHAKNGLIDIVKVKAALGLSVSNKEIREVCDRLGIHHQQVGHNTYIHYWHTETLKKYYER